ncbi:hypothetical protein [Candidatus Venteria ishoeyi]|uniref:Translation initiation factor 2 n=1 Tax=Candidatus Venteria ishoeyi TaxID=1899563 RepID=A0A1H6F6D7_9GAMM|nr:hypothetical protein [Candidatus Venteria ishoeyi]MDM8545656.1 hypothetical protein [Candidatus Venteria ishoeyi]SEH04554.1 Uncharacterised protein [Candidatus Venteria ishoeyi]
MPNSVTENLSDQELICQSAEKAFHSVEIRSQMQLRLATRITAIIRVGMISIGAMSIAILFLILVLSYYLKDMIVAMEVMNNHFSSMSSDMAVMEQRIAKMEQAVVAMPDIVTNVKTMNQSVAFMTHDIHTISASMDNMQNRVNSVSNNMVTMSQTFHAMDGAVYGIGRDVNTMSDPMKGFNMFRSFMPSN